MTKEKKVTTVPLMLTGGCHEGGRGEEERLLLALSA